MNEKTTTPLQNIRRKPNGIELQIKGQRNFLFATSNAATALNSFYTAAEQDLKKREVHLERLAPPDVAPWPQSEPKRNGFLEMATRGWKAIAGLFTKRKTEVDPGVPPPAAVGDMPVAPLRSSSPTVNGAASFHTSEIPLAPLAEAPPVLPGSAEPASGAFRPPTTVPSPAGESPRRWPNPAVTDTRVPSNTPDGTRSEPSPAASGAAGEPAAPVAAQSDLFISSVAADKDHVKIAWSNGVEMTYPKDSEIGKLLGTAYQKLKEMGISVDGFESLDDKHVEGKDPSVAKITPTVPLLESPAGPTTEAGRGKEAKPAPEVVPASEAHEPDAGEEAAARALFRDPEAPAQPPPPGAKPATMRSNELARVAEKLTPDNISDIHLAIRTLAGLDADMAQKKNGVGFNRYDSERGHQLAQVEELTAKQAALARAIVLRYPTQVPQTLLERIQDAGKDEASNSVSPAASTPAPTEAPPSNLPSADLPAPLAPGEPAIGPQSPPSANETAPANSADQPSRTEPLVDAIAQPASSGETIVAPPPAEEDVARDLTSADRAAPPAAEAAPESRAQELIRLGSKITPDEIQDISTAVGVLAEIADDTSTRGKALGFRFKLTPAEAFLAREFVLQHKIELPDDLVERIEAPMKERAMDAASPATVDPTETSSISETRTNHGPMATDNGAPPPEAREQKKGKDQPHAEPDSLRDKIEELAGDELSKAVAAAIPDISATLAEAPSGPAPASNLPSPAASPSIRAPLPLPPIADAVPNMFRVSFNNEFVPTVMLELPEGGQAVVYPGELAAEPFEKAIKGENGQPRLTHVTLKEGRGVDGNYAQEILSLHFDGESTPMPYADWLKAVTPPAPAQSITDTLLPAAIPEPTMALTAKLALPVLNTIVTGDEPQKVTFAAKPPAAPQPSRMPVEMDV